MNVHYGLSQLMWVEAVCPYFSLADIQAFRLCSKDCRSLIYRALPLCIEVLETTRTQLQVNPWLQEEEDQYIARQSQRQDLLELAPYSTNTYTKDSLSRLERMKNAPKPVLEAVLLVNMLLKYPPAVDNPFRYWKKNVYHLLKAYDRNTVSHTEKQALKEFLEKYSEEEVKRASVDCRGIYQFLKAVWLSSTLEPITLSGIRVEIQKVTKVITVLKRLQRNNVS